jgi:Zn-dependent protease
VRWCILLAMTLDTTWIIFALPSIIIASGVHEFAHAFAAFKLGDATAKANGRMTINPLAHIDLLGVLSMIFFRFGWSKPVPINEYNFANRRLGTALTALAGPFSNLLLLLLAALLNCIFKPELGSMLQLFLLIFAIVNCALAVFNLIPIPPLDGHKIVRGLLPKKPSYYWDDLENYSVILIVLLVIPVFPFGSIASLIISTAVNGIIDILGFY